MTTVLNCPPAPFPASFASPSPESASPSPPGLDVTAVKARQKVAWGTGDYAVIGTTLQIVGEQLCEAVDLHAGERVLDVAAGNGNASLAAARRYGEVTALDYVPSLLERARERAQAERLPIEIREGDAERLDLPDASFDVVLSTFGVMFTPDQEQAARELLRVCRPGGRIGLANWTPSGFIGQVFRLLGRFHPPAPGLKPPSAWGTVERLKELFGAGAASITARTRHFSMRYRSAEHWLEVFRTYYGPVNKAFAALAPEQQPALQQELLALLRASDLSSGSSLVVPSEYLEAVIERA